MDNTPAQASTDDSVLAASDTTVDVDNAAAVVTDAAETTLTPSRIATVLAAIGGSVEDDDHLVVVLERTVEIAQEAIDGASSCGVTIALGGRTYSAVHTDKRTLAVDAHQYEAGDGPCLEAARTGEIVRVDVDAAQQAWPEFARLARTDGIRSFLAAPLRTDTLELGSFNLYGVSPKAFDNLDEAILDALTTVVSRALGDYARLRSAEEVSSGLRDALAHRAPIEQAKGILMAMHGVDADAAFAILATRSQNENRKLRDIAREFVSQVSTPRVDDSGAA
ncbi:GAF and ANTAR domain-containing protein [Rhodococcoides trifolii]|nr:GAF and ANTAR domain-containing protein [Rhodococcus trifolii]